MAKEWYCWVQYGKGLAPFRRGGDPLWNAMELWIRERYRNSTDKFWQSIDKRRQDMEGWCDDSDRNGLAMM